VEGIKRRRLGAQFWREALEHFATSGLAVSAFCQREGVSTKTFYRWQDRLEKGAMATTLPAQRGAAPFVDLGALIQGGMNASGLDLKLDLGGGLTLHLVRG
jgi:putative transposase